jgi:hypothetical protein
LRLLSISCTLARRKVESKISTSRKEPNEMKYLLLIYNNEQSWNAITETERQQIYGDYRKLREQLLSRGQFVTGSQLQPISTATSVRVRDGKELVTDGPFAETHEQLGGYFLIEAENLDEATSIAAQIPSAKIGTIEVRPLVETAAPASA